MKVLINRLGNNPVNSFFLIVILSPSVKLVTFIVRFDTLDSLLPVCHFYLQYQQIFNHTKRTKDLLICFSRVK